ncbi:lipid-transfer protein [Pseudonocardia halophobica]|uniref:Lipid-transfer protein n=1 Tax=Pseudonocardia halophobica TaxID=29401 RepID=A0A9W6NUS2_9PSEU|nr:acetyl-CoA acetyltransferase [Pseudonocardia halophobica]GLL10600.1 lipid-transfer protein [Pseudonocardia halophobica]
MTGRTAGSGVAVVGLGETEYYRHGGSPHPEFRLVLDAVRAAAEDAGIDPREIDGYCSFSDDRNAPTRIATALGARDLALSTMQWGGGGGGGAAAVANAAAALAAGYARYVCVFRGLAQGQFGRFGTASTSPHAEWPSSYEAPYGVLSAAQLFAMRVRRFMHDHGVTQEPLRAIALASYHHAQQNPRAVMYGRPLTPELYDRSRWIVEPFHLFDCCQENDGAAAVILTTTNRARHLRQRPAILMAAAQGADPRQSAAAHNAPDYASANTRNVARRLYAMAGLGPRDIDVVQSYENFTGGVMMSLVEHGFCEPEECVEYMTLDNFSVGTGKCPLNTSGGNLAECYMHGLGLVVEAVRQIRGNSPNQVPDAETSMVCSGPMAELVSSLILRR